MVLARARQRKLLHVTRYIYELSHGEDSKVEYIEQTVSHLSIEHMPLDDDYYSTSTFIDLYSTQ